MATRLTGAATRPHAMGMTYGIFSTKASGVSSTIRAIFGVSLK